MKVHRDSYDKKHWRPAGSIEINGKYSKELPIYIIGGIRDGARGCHFFTTKSKAKLFRDGALAFKNYFTYKLKGYIRDL